MTNNPKSPAQSAPVPSSNPVYQAEERLPGVFTVRCVDTGDWMLGDYDTLASAQRMARRLTANIDLPPPLLRALKTLAATGKLSLHHLAEQHHGKVCPYDETEKGRKLLKKLMEHGLAEPCPFLVDGRQAAQITHWGLEWLGKTPNRN